MATVTKQKQAERAEAIDHLRTLLNPGDTVYTVLRKVSASGMSRHIDLYVIRDNRPLRITWHACRTTSVMTYDQRAESARISGCGMDMGFHAVYSLASVLFADDERLTRSDSGYALRNEWM